MKVPEVAILLLLLPATLEALLSFARTEGLNMLPRLESFLQNKTEG